MRCLDSGRANLAVAVLEREVLWPRRGQEGMRGHRRHCVPSQPPSEDFYLGGIKLGPIVVITFPGVGVQKL